MAEIDPLIPILLIGVIALVIGAVIGAGLVLFFGPKEQTAQRSDRNLVEVLRIWRDRRSGILRLEFGGKIYGSVDDLSVRQHSGAGRLLDELRNWLGLGELDQRFAVYAPPEASQPASSDASPPPPAVVASSPSTPTPPSQQTAASPPVIQNLPPPVATTRTVSPSTSHQTPIDDAQTEVEPVKTGPFDSLARLFNPKSKEEPKPLSIAAQIDVIVQSRLPDTPLRGRNIHISDLPNRGLVVVVDQNQYDGVGDVSDLEVRRFLQECVGEWERKIVAGEEKK